MLVLPLLVATTSLKVNRPAKRVVDFYSKPKNYEFVDIESISYFRYMLIMMIIMTDHSTTTPVIKQLNGYR